MIILRGLLAIVVGLVAAALINTILLASMHGEPFPPAISDLRFISLGAAVGIVLTTPSWLLFCMILLPVVTHRVRLRRDLPMLTYLSIAALLGSLLILPIALLIADRETSALFIAELAPLGGIGGLSIALAWKWLILNQLGDRQIAKRGV